MPYNGRKKKKVMAPTLSRNSKHPLNTAMNAAKNKDIDEVLWKLLESDIQQIKLRDAFVTTDRIFAIVLSEICKRNDKQADEVIDDDETMDFIKQAMDAKERNL